MTSQKCQTIRKAWRVWAKALGQKDGRNDREADTIAGIRTLIFVSYMVTNIAIVANAVRHWDNRQTVPMVDHAIDDRVILNK
tara:strand:+ start:18626 stop:18871 length:246 start_codon:yes stop_codon:yes gene_type:complete